MQNPTHRGTLTLNLRQLEVLEALHAEAGGTTRPCLSNHVPNHRPGWHLRIAGWHHEGWVCDECSGSLLHLVLLPQGEVLKAQQQLERDFHKAEVPDEGGSRWATRLWPSYVPVAEVEKKVLSLWQESPALRSGPAPLIWPAGRWAHGYRL